MHATYAVGGALAFLLVALAGCSGDFEVRQTEPFQVEIDDDEGHTMTVRENGDAQAVAFETADVEEVEVVVEVTKVSTDPCDLTVTIEDEDTGAVLATKTITVGGDMDDNMTDDGNMTGNETGNGTADPGMAEDGDTVVQNIFVDVRGAKNIVVVTQANTGEAEVNVVANSSSGSGDVTQDQNNTGNQAGP